jgi:hypothetical protein
MILPLILFVRTFCCGGDSLPALTSLLNIGVFVSSGFAYPHIEDGISLDYGISPDYKDSKGSASSFGIECMLRPEKKNRFILTYQQLTYSYRTEFFYDTYFPDCLLLEVPIITVHSIPVMYDRILIRKKRLEWSCSGGLVVNRRKESQRLISYYSMKNNNVGHFRENSTNNERISNGVTVASRFEIKMKNSFSIQFSTQYNRSFRPTRDYRQIEIFTIKTGLNYLF